MAGFYARFTLKGDVPRTFGIPESVPLRGNVSRVYTSPDMAAQYATEQLSGKEIVSLEIFNEDGSLAKRVV
jgi:hypothetical protein